jgi:hypothetical protein
MLPYRRRRRLRHRTCAMSNTIGFSWKTRTMPTTRICGVVEEFDR